MPIISSIQFRPEMALCQAETSANLRRIEGLLDQAGRMGSEVIALPELCSTGYSFMGPEQAAMVSEPRDGLTSRFMADAARQLEAYVAWGFVETDGSSLYNSASIAGPDGQIIMTSRKMNLWGNDFLWASPGRFPPPVVRTDFGMMSAIVCRDVRNRIPKVPKVASGPMFDVKPDIVTVHVNWGKGGFPATQWMDIVEDLGCVAVVSNRWGVERNGEFEQDFGQGGSAIIEPDWTVHTEGIRWGADCVVCHRVDMDKGPLL
jgi:predicted amidohydrolase